MYVSLVQSSGRGLFMLCMALSAIVLAFSGCDSRATGESGADTIVLDAEIPDAMLLATDAAMVLDLGSHFSHREAGERLAYTVEVDGEAVGASISGSELTVTPAFIGESALVVRAIDEDGRSISDTFSIRVSARSLEGVAIPTSTWEVIFDGREVHIGRVFTDCVMVPLPNHGGFDIRQEVHLGRDGFSNSPGYEFEMSRTSSEPCQNSGQLQWSSEDDASASATYFDPNGGHQLYAIDSWETEIVYSQTDSQPPVRERSGSIRVSLADGRIATGIFR